MRTLKYIKSLLGTKHTRRYKQVDVIDADVICKFQIWVAHSTLAGEWKCLTL
ncbi:MAG: hypothetical protein GY941_09775 [Planctomycetes bacterium]|nr:hypothetical protein [Planctomycetota bacterium]